MTEILAWHWLPNDLKLRDGNVAAAGYVYEVEPPAELCRWGLHASESPLDALGYARGNMVSRVLLSGDVVRGDDKIVAIRREVLWIADAEETLRSFARRCALDVVHLWDAPDVVREYLEAGDESKRDAAWAAAGDAAGAAARDAAWAAAGDAAWAAARAAAGAAARARKKQSTLLTTMLEDLAPEPAEMR